MKELIEQADRLLARIPVNGDAVLLMADARKALGQAYRMAMETEEAANETDRERK